MATSDIYPSLESSNNVSSTDHQGRLFIALPSANSFDNRIALTTNGNLTPSPNSAENNPRPTSTTRITNNRSNLCQIIFNRYSQRNSASAPVQVQRQQSYRQAQETDEISPPEGAPANSLNGNTQDVSSPSPITTDSASRNNPPDSEASTNGNTQNGSSSPNR